jgi:hypothetical protein
VNNKQNPEKNVNVDHLFGSLLTGDPTLLHRAAFKLGFSVIMTCLQYPCPLPSAAGYCWLYLGILRCTTVCEWFILSSTCSTKHPYQKPTVEKMKNKDNQWI